MTTSRKTISARTRFEVFKRDAFRCRYCGGMAPKVILEVDHINPVAKGGKNSITNYVTSCQECNRGKSDRKLDDHPTLKALPRQLEEFTESQKLEIAVQALKQRGHYPLLRNQREMVAAAIKKYTITVVLTIIDNYVPMWGASPTGRIRYEPLLDVSNL